MVRDSETIVALRAQVASLEKQLAEVSAARGLSAGNAALPPTAAAAARPAPSPPSQCTIWADRHVHKNGGTTMRGIFGNLTDYNVIQHIDTFIVGLKHWRKLMAGLATLTPPCSEALSHTMIALELHEDTAEWGWHMRALRELRAKTSCCRVLLTTRTRAPLEHYVSFYRWGVMPRFKMFNRTIDWWAPHNFQSTLLWRGAPHKQWWMDGNRGSNVAAWYREFDNASFDGLSSMLEDDFDVVYPMERFEEGLRMIARKLGGHAVVAAGGAAGGGAAAARGRDDGDRPASSDGSASSNGSASSGGPAFSGGPASSIVLQDLMRAYSGTHLIPSWGTTNAGLRGEKKESEIQAVCPGHPKNTSCADLVRT